MSTTKTRRRRAGKRTHLMPPDVRKLLDAAKEIGRHSHRNYTLILLAYRHGLRLGELTGLRWNMIDFQRRVLRVPRPGKSLNPEHPLNAPELQALRKLRKEYPGSTYLFMTDRGTRLSQRNISRIVAAAGRHARLKMHVSPKALRHACGYALAKAGHNPLAIQHFLGYQDARYVLRFLEMPDKPFRDFGRGL
jgi:type 1 fimbriae regulatory protein FimB/type 1 fimbriae regulatory protein FimE